MYWGRKFGGGMIPVSALHIVGRLTRRCYSGYDCQCQWYRTGTISLVTGASAGAGSSVMPDALPARYKTCQWMAELPDAVCSDSAAQPRFDAAFTLQSWIEYNADELLRSGTVSTPAATPRADLPRL